MARVVLRSASWAGLSSRLRPGAGLSSRLRPRAAAMSSGIDPSRLTVELTDKPAAKPANESLKGMFGRYFTDHMLEIDWTADEGWGAPRIAPYGPLALSPAAMCLHYALECFEGMKCYRDGEGRLRLFRPDCNMERMNSSMERLAMPAFDGDAFVACLKELLRRDADWVPGGDGYSMYIRPTAIATDPFLGVGQASRVKLFAILSPVGPYYPEGFQPIRVYADPHNVRAWPGGSGNTKLGSNYGPSITPQIAAARDHACQQVLYLFGPEKRVTEVGAMNLFVLWRGADGARELVTAPLDAGDILPGVTRRSVLELARAWPDVDVVSERHFTIDELLEASREGRVEEVFGAGTAAVVAPVKAIQYGDDAEIVVPTGESIGPIAQRVWDELLAIQYGKVEHPWSVLV